jgi:nitric oxide reductase NorD protein
MQRSLQNHLAGLNGNLVDFWEIDEFSDQLAGFTDHQREELLKGMAAIWPVSHALCLDFLAQSDNLLKCLHHSQLPEWINALLDIYEKEGLQQAARFMREVETSYLCRIRGETGLTFEQAKGRLLPYLHALAGRDLELAAGTEIHTDGQTIFLPPAIAIFPTEKENFLTYKLIASCQWGLLAGGTFEVRLHGAEPLIKNLARRYRRPLPTEKPFPDNFSALFPDPLLAADLFCLTEFLRIRNLLEKELPGLMRDSLPVLEQIQRLRPELSSFHPGKCRALEALKQWGLIRRSKSRLPADEQKIFARAVRLLDRFGASPRSAGESMKTTALLYHLFTGFPGEYSGSPPLLLSGSLQGAAVQAARERRRQEAKQQFIKALGAILPAGPAEETDTDRQESRRPAGLPDTEGLALVLGAGPRLGDEPAEEQNSPEYLVIGGREFRIPEGLQPLAREIINDLGRIPDHYISAALQQAGSAPILGPGPAVREGESASGPLVYDEWDFRRGGFRKNWCVLLEREVRPVGGTFVEHTLAKYHGQLRQLKRQFEMMRLQQRFLRRQPDGDEIDLDAVTEALSDSRAGCSPSENLFIRLSRDERDIAVVFLVDMSSSTEGWVNTTIKEALVLMCEALEVLGDRYAIYGFSGMRRLRSELYHIKQLDEPYGDTVKGRLAAIAPRDYTRMGPPIRHLTRILAATDARVRLLITLADGKPEDYDDYKGDYAIEDTRHALIEAKAAAIHPFCITIDRQSHGYIPHMYGEVNYIFLDEIRKLPLRMPEIYRTLTT